MSKTKRLLSVLLAAVMMFTSLAVGASALPSYSIDGALSYDNIDNPVLTVDQCSTMMLDYLDEELAEEGDDLVFEIGNISLDARTIDNALDSIWDIRCNEAIFTELLLGKDLVTLDVSAISTHRRASAGNTDTDLLYDVVRGIREEIISLGGSIMFDSTVTDIKRDSYGRATSVTVNGSFDIECSALFLCIGHSARDTFSLLSDMDFYITPKAISAGVRIEHLQSDISEALYGKYAEYEALEKAQYTLSAKNGDRGVYSFCMCPGGTVVASASDTDEIVTNGMSNFKRDGLNANSAIAVSVNTSDYGNTVDGAINFQKRIEQAAFNLAGGDGTAPIQLLGDFLSDSKTLHEPKRIVPSYTGKTKLCNIKNVFPEFINSSLSFGFSMFERHIKGFSVSDAVLTAPETRTSSPVRINRNEDRLSLSSANIYPCGEGAGYAGGITSAAVDGLKSAIYYLNSKR